MKSETIFPAPAHVKTQLRTRTGERYRHELKYRISYGEKAVLELRLAPLLQRDAHAGPDGYLIRSLYFDDCWNSAYAEKDAGILARKKYRIRIYNGSDAVIRLERKKKLLVYDPAMHDYTAEPPQWQELRPNHFVLCNATEAAQWIREL